MLFWDHILLFIPSHLQILSLSAESIGEYHMLGIQEYITTPSWGHFLKIYLELSVNENTIYLKQGDIEKVVLEVKLRALHS